MMGLSSEPPARSFASAVQQFLVKYIFPKLSSSELARGCASALAEFAQTSDITQLVLKSRGAGYTNLERMKLVRALQTGSS